MLFYLYLISVPVCALLVFGIVNGYFRGEYPEIIGKYDFVVYISMALYGGISSIFGLGLFYLLSHGAKHGISYKLGKI